jgi:hypothetical protein
MSTAQGSREHDLSKPTPGIVVAAEAVLAKCSSVPMSETESSIGVLVLWALDAVGSGLVSREDAGRVFAMLAESLIGAERASGVSPAMKQILQLGPRFPQWTDLQTGEAADLRALAFGMLETSV